MRACSSEVNTVLTSLSHAFDGVANQISVVELYEIVLSSSIERLTSGDVDVVISEQGDTIDAMFVLSGTALVDSSPYNQTVGTVNSVTINNGYYDLSDGNLTVTINTPVVADEYEFIAEFILFDYPALGFADLGAILLMYQGSFAISVSATFIKVHTWTSGIIVAMINVSLNTVYTVKVRYTASTIKLYLNNSLVAEHNNSMPMVIEDNVVIGVGGWTFSNTDNRFIGLLRNIAWSAVTAGAINHHYSSAISVERDDISQQAGIEVDETTVKLYCNADSLMNDLPIPQFALIGGFDNAEIKISLAILSDVFSVVGVIELFTGKVTDVTIDSILVKLTVSSDKIKLDTQVPTKIYQPTCTHTLYDSGCKLNKDTWKESNSAISGSNAVSIQFNTGNGENFFTFGKILFTSGQNAGVTRTVKYFAKSGSVGTATLAQPLPFAVAVGDTFDIWAGCDKLRSTCTSKFNNAAQFLGWEYVPVPEASI